MYAFYSLVVYIFYTLFKKDGSQEEEEEEEGKEGEGGEGGPPGPPKYQGGGPSQGLKAFSLDPPPKRAKKPPQKDLWKELTELESSSESDQRSSTEEEEEEEEEEEGLDLGEAPTPLSEFRSLKQAATAKLSLAEMGSSGEKVLLPLP
nr:kinesin-like protein KIFC2 [Anolis sagrei ordinatus]